MRETALGARHAIVLAAGVGRRLQAILPSAPKGLLVLGTEPIIARSIRLMKASGVSHITIVAGHLAEQYAAFAKGRSDVAIAVNERYADSGSMASLAVALARPELAGEPVLIVESDLVYEARALAALAREPAPDATLLSGTTGAGDEVWVYAPDGRLETMSKRAAALPGVTGEFVGITRLSAAAAAALRRRFDAFVAASGHARMDYETDGLVALARDHVIAPVLVTDLHWGEIDDERQLDRVRRHVWPALQ